jgi:hypothetical protein
MSRITQFILLLVLSHTMGPLAAQEITDFGNVAEAFELDPGKIHNVYIAPGINTSIRFMSEKKVKKVFLGEEILSVDYDEETNAVQLRATPGLDQGMTNLNIVVDGDIYVFLVQIVTDTRVQYTINCTFPHSAETKEGRTAPPPSNVKPVKPMEIDTVGAVRAIERGRVDPLFRAQNPNIFTFPIRKVYVWNQSYVQLVDAHYFQSQDMIVLKVDWTNRSDRGLYLHANQIEVWVANHKVPVTARQQTNTLVFPGQRDVVYLFIQGLRLGVDNNWELRLPPEASTVEALLK